MQPPGSSITGEQKKCWLCWAKSLTGFKLDAIYANIMQHCPTWCTNERNVLCPTWWHNMLRSFAQAFKKQKDIVKPTNKVIPVSRQTRFNLSNQGCYCKKERCHSHRAKALSTFWKTSVFILSKTHKKICIHTSVFIEFLTVHIRPRKRINDVRVFDNLRFRPSTLV